jgi:hypothetical protein
VQTGRRKQLEKQIRKNPQLESVVADLETKIHGLSRQQLSGGGFQLEPIKHTNGALWTIRAGKGPRMVCQILGDLLELLEFQDHNGAYRKSSLVALTAKLFFR